MATNLRPEPGSIPESPGVYRFRDANGRVIYVGKAKNLRSRLSSYFQDFAALHPRTQTMVSTAADVDWTVVGTEVDALQLEYSWIKEYEPRFNVRYRDDKSYPYLAVSLGEEIPRVQVMRGSKRKGVRYFGPYSHAWAIRETVDLLLRVFPVRTCSSGVFRRARASDRPCLLGYIDKCSAPCVGRVTPEQHRRLAEDFCAFMAGDTGRFIRQLEGRMREAAADQEYERAARIRDDIQALRTALEKQSVVLEDSTDCDVIAFAEEPMEAAAQIFYVRGGRIRGQRGWVVDRVEDVDTPGLVEQFLTQIYGGLSPASAEGDPAGAVATETDTDAVLSREALPREVLVSALPADQEAVTEWLSGIRGGRVSLRVPQRGDKRALLETVARNAQQVLARHKARRAGDLSTRSRALGEIQEALGLEEAPLRIECYDVSNLQGTNVVASMVVFEDGLARKSEYRRFTIRGRGAAVTSPPGPREDGASGPAREEGPRQDDTASIHEVIRRRFTRYLENSRKSGEAGGATSVGDASATADGIGEHEDGQDGSHPPASGGESFAYPPGLVVVDGGRPQVRAAQRALDELGIDDVAVCGLAKRLEEVWLPHEEDPVILPRTSEGLYLLQRVRDEAHRFAIAHHRRRRSTALTTSALDDVPGLGPARRKALLKHFGSLKRLKSASVEEIARVKGIGPRIAETIHAALGGEAEAAVADTEAARQHSSNESEGNAE